MDYSIVLPTTTQEHVDHNGLIEVTRQTENDILYENVYTIAKYFKRELNYDNVPFDRTGVFLKKYSALLFTEHDYDIAASGDDKSYINYGACCFQRVSFIKDHGERWVLRWVWMHPFFRNKDRFRALWKIFEEKFGDFYIDAPVSVNMEKFLERVKSEHLVLKVPQ